MAERRKQDTDRAAVASAEPEKNGKSTDAGTPAAGTSPTYRECMKNHAAAMGAHAIDGCMEFMPGGAPGTPESLNCAACGCHRNFHRRDGCGASNPSKRSPFSPHLLLLPLPPFTGHVRRPPTMEDISPPAAEPTSPARERGQSSRKRCRTKFTREQKEEMRAFAERVGWRIQGNDSEELRGFCARVGVKRHVLKVWMHNNKGVLAAAAGSGGGDAGDLYESDAAQDVYV